MRYFDFHIFYERGDSFSKFIALDIDEEDKDEDTLIKIAVEEKHISREESNQVDYVEEITEEEYYELKIR